MIVVTKLASKVLISAGLICYGIASLAADIHGVRVWPSSDKTRIVFDLSQSVEYKVFVIPSPDRIVIDFKNTRANKKLLSSIRTNKLLKDIRSATQPNNAHRVVLDLRSKAQFRTFQLGPANNRGHRLVVDLTDKTKSTPTLPVTRTINQPVAQLQNKPAGQLQPALLRDLVIAVDAGHGGKDPGAIGKGGTREKEVALSIARKLAQKINATHGMKAVMTRNSDKFLELRQRMQIARTNHADLFISVHADAFKNHMVRGSSVYILSENGASSEAARFLAERENAADHIGGVSLDQKDKLLKEVLVNLSQNAVRDASYNVADKVLRGLSTVGAVHKPSVQHAGFMVLKSPDIPSILIETAFISNPLEERKLLNPHEQNKLVNAIHAGVTNYFTEYAPPDTRLAAR